ncbi:MAG: methylmalonyl-CoA mutase, C-terminal domain [Pseudonocardiales bacterium]|nr:methylmalonyl-CoA mutase, C-terminal domain [Pseudonocardiales bacterium]
MSDTAGTTAPHIDTADEPASQYRVLVAKVGMDGHDRGARVIARTLRDAGMEVIYTGRHVTMEFVASTALQEDVDVLGLSILSGAHVALTRTLFEHLENVGAEDVAVVVGGTVATERERQELLDLGVADVFPGGTPLAAIPGRVAAVAAARRTRLGL